MPRDMLGEVLAGEAGLWDDGAYALSECLAAVGRCLVPVHPAQVHVGERQVPAWLGVTAREGDRMLRRRCSPDVDVVDLLYLHGSRCSLQ